MFWWLASHLPFVGAIKAFVIEFSYFVAAAAFGAAAVFLLFWNPLPYFDRWPVIGRIYSAARDTVVVICFALACLCAGYGRGYMVRGDADRSAALESVIREKDRELKQAQEDARAAAAITESISAQTETMRRRQGELQAKIDEFEGERANNGGSDAKACPSGRGAFSERGAGLVREILRRDARRAPGSAR